MEHNLFHLFLQDMPIMEKMKIFAEQNDNENSNVGFEYDGVFIVNPFMDETGRKEVDPVEYYGEELLRLYGEQFCEEMEKVKESYINVLEKSYMTDWKKELDDFVDEESKRIVGEEALFNDGHIHQPLNDVIHEAEDIKKEHIGLKKEEVELTDIYKKALFSYQNFARKFEILKRTGRNLEQMSRFLKPGDWHRFGYEDGNIEFLSYQPYVTVKVLENTDHEISIDQDHLIIHGKEKDHVIDECSLEKLTQICQSEEKTKYHSADKEDKSL